MIKHFVNLTNGIEAIPSINGEINFLRIQSTTLERKDWIKLFTELDYNFLMYLALGYECNVYDYGTNRLFSKTIYQGLPIIKYVLSKYWLGIEIPAERLTRSGQTIAADKKMYDHIYDQLFTYNSTKEKHSLKNKYKYFKQYLRTDEIKLYGISDSTQNDGNVPYYRDILHKTCIY